MESVNASDTKADTLNLFGKAFPSCKDANTNSNGQMRWASLKLKGAAKNELYLACGETIAAAADCSDPAYKSAHKGECCPSVSEDDDVCYTTCSEEGTWAWSDASTTVSQVLGSDWQKKALTKNYQECHSTVSSEFNSERRCWDVWNLLDSLGYSKLESIVIASSTPHNRSLCDSAMPCNQYNETILCLALLGSATIDVKDVTGNVEEFATGLYQNANYHLWECKQVPGEEKRCKNGW